MYERFTDRARKVMQFANQETQRFNHEYIGTEHILLGLVKEGSGVAANVLKNLDIDLTKIRQEVEKIVQPGPDTVTMGKLPQTPRAKKVIEYSIEEARNLNHNYVGTEHLLLGLLREQEGVAAQVLTNLGLKLEDAREEVRNLLGHNLDPNDGGEAGTAKRKSKTPALDSFGRDLTELARQGRLDPAIGWHREVDQIIQILSRRTRNNPLLLSEVGLDKTAIVENLAQHVVDNNVPELLRDHRIVVLDFAMMLGGSQYKGQFEERVKAVVNETRRAGNIVLFIDDLNTFFGAGGNRVVDASHIAKPALARGNIRCVGVATLDEYRNFIEKDAALGRHFQPIIVHPPSKEETIEILRALRDRYEAHHRVQIKDEALLAAAELSDMFITNNSQPDKAIDLIDSAGSRVRLKAVTPPPDLRELDTQIERLNQEKEAAVAEQDFEKGARFRDQADKLRKKKEQITKEWRDKQVATEGLIDEGVIAEVVSDMTGIPLREVLDRDLSSLPRRPESRRLGLPDYERLQAESVLPQQEVEIKSGFGFVLLPHRPEFQAIFDHAIRPAMAANGIEAKKADDIYEPGSILGQVWTYIRTAEVIVADVSSINPNVVYELGLCFGLKRCPILLVRDPTELPFNLRSLRYIQYENNLQGAEALKTNLTRAIGEFLAASRARRIEE